jgi:hypothetical protein
MKPVSAVLTPIVRCRLLNRFTALTAAHMGGDDYTTRGRNNEKMLKTYGNWLFCGHSMRLCSIRTTHYCSL